MAAATDRRLHAQRERQRQAYAESTAAYEQAVAGSGLLAFRPESQLLKTVALELILVEPGEQSHEPRWVAQSLPQPGGPGRPAYLHVPSELVAPLATFASWPVGRVFALADLPTRGDDVFLCACAARSLCGLGVSLPVRPDCSRLAKPSQDSVA